MRRTLTYNIVGNEKYRVLELRPIAKSEDYLIFIDNKVRYFGKKFTFKEALEQLKSLESSGVKLEPTFRWKKEHGKKIRDYLLAEPARAKREPRQRHWGWS